MSFQCIYVQVHAKAREESMVPQITLCLLLSILKVPFLIIDRLSTQIVQNNDVQQSDNIWAFKLCILKLQKEYKVLI